MAELARRLGDAETGLDEAAVLKDEKLDEVLEQNALLEAQMAASVQEHRASMGECELRAQLAERELAHATRAHEQAREEAARDAAHAAEQHARAIDARDAVTRLELATARETAAAELALAAGREQVRFLLFALFLFHLAFFCSFAHRLLCRSPRLSSCAAAREQAVVKERDQLAIAHTKVSCLLSTVTFYANLAHSLTRSP
jgi:hypothetical protein